MPWLQQDVSPMYFRFHWHRLNTFFLFPTHFFTLSCPALYVTACSGFGDIPFKQSPLFTRRILYNLLPGFHNTSPWEEFLVRNLSPPYISAEPDIVHRRLDTCHSSNAASSRTNTQTPLTVTNNIPFTRKPFRSFKKKIRPHESFTPVPHPGLGRFCGSV